MLQSYDLILGPKWYPTLGKPREDKAEVSRAIVASQVPYLPSSKNEGRQNSILNCIDAVFSDNILCTFHLPVTLHFFRLLVCLGMCVQLHPSVPPVSSDPFAPVQDHIIEWQDSSGLSSGDVCIYYSTNNESCL